MRTFVAWHSIPGSDRAGVVLITAPTRETGEDILQRYIFNHVHFYLAETSRLVEISCTDERLYELGSCDTEDGKPKTNPAKMTPSTIGNQP